MKTLIIYDSTGKILMSQSGGYTVPAGNVHVDDAVKFIEWEIPNGYYAESVNPETNEPILKEIPKTAEQQQIEALQAATDAQAEAILALMDVFAATGDISGMVE